MQRAVVAGAEALLWSEVHNLEHVCRRLPLGVVGQRQVQVRLLDACDAPPAWEQHSPPGRAIRRWVGGCLNLTKAARLIVGVVIDRSTHFMDCLVLCMQDSAIGVRNCPAATCTSGGLNLKGVELACGGLARAGSCCWEHALTHIAEQGCNLQQKYIVLLPTTEPVPVPLLPASAPLPPLVPPAGPPL